MDSGNSGSLQSSSGGDEEYDSRAAADSVSAFMSGGGGGGGGPVSNPPPFFDPLSDYLQLHQNPNLSFLNPSNAWPRNSNTAPRSDPNPNANPTSHHDDNTNPMLQNSPPFIPSFRPPPTGGGADLVPPPPPQLQSQNQNQPPAAARNPKKRSRASRRAPTTVLTTDTNNFRAIVQEFTGIPAAPFSSNTSSFPRSRLDLFGSTSFHAPPYLRRPFAQKPQPPLPFLPSSSSSLQINSAAVDGGVAPSNPTNNNKNDNHIIITSVNSSTTINEASSSSTSPNLFNNNININPNPLLTSFLQSNPKFPFPNSKPNFGIPSYHHGDDHISATDHSINNNNNAAIWNNNPASPDGNRDDRINLNGAGAYNFPAATSSFGGGKAPENVAAAASARGGGEGMVESWICSSD